MDLRNKYQYDIVNKNSVRICPECDIPLSTIDLNIKGEFQIERCNKCFGLFFDPGEIEDFLEHSVAGVIHINQQHMTNINLDRYKKDKSIRYRKCPECRKFMQRSNYAHKSGVIIDRCQQHGVWIDSGETTHLMEWKKAGGELLHAKVKLQQENNHRSKTYKMYSNDNQQGKKHSFDIEDDLLETINRLFNRLF
ncbi:MAG: zf-TFIIB domain-containing protein [Pseudomonadota bacterium]